MRPDMVLPNSSDARRPATWARLRSRRRSSGLGSWHKASVAIRRCAATEVSSAFGSALGYWAWYRWASCSRSVSDAAGAGAWPIGSVVAGVEQPKHHAAAGDPIESARGAPGCYPQLDCGGRADMAVGGPPPGSAQSRPGAKPDALALLQPAPTGPFLNEVCDPMVRTERHHR